MEGCALNFGLERRKITQLHDNKAANVSVEKEAFRKGKQVDNGSLNNIHGKLVHRRQRGNDTAVHQFISNL